jgi:hypothetical protein
MKSSKKRKPVGEKTRAEDEKLRQELRHFDLKKFDRLLGKAVASSK